MQRPSQPGLFCADRGCFRRLVSPSGSATLATQNGAPPSSGRFFEGPERRGESLTAALEGVGRPGRRDDDVVALGAASYVTPTPATLSELTLTLLAVYSGVALAGWWALRTLSGR